MSGSAIALAARAARAKILKVAADALEADAGDLEIVEGKVRVVGSPGTEISLGTIAVLSNPLRYAFDEASKAATQFVVGDPDMPPVGEDDEPGIEGKGYYSPLRSTFANGMHAVVVETDVDTAEIKVLRYCVVHDCGRLINPMIVQGQVHGGVAQGIGGALYERMVYDSDGQLQNASFMDFLMPYVSELPDRIEIDHLETPSPLNPLGIKGAGEAGCHPERGSVRFGDLGRGGLRDHLDADLAERAVRASACPRSQIRPSTVRPSQIRPQHSPTQKELTDEGGRPGNPARADRAGLGRAERPGGAGAHHSGLPAARSDRTGCLRDDRDGRGGQHQGQLRRHGRAGRPPASRTPS